MSCILGLDEHTVQVCLIQQIMNFLFQVPLLMQFLIHLNEIRRFPTRLSSDGLHPCL
jgi:hypothetical protein